MVLESSPEDRWAQALGADGTVRGGFHVDQPDRYQFVLTEPDGTVVRERTWRAVSARADAAPEVQLLLPESDLEVKPTDDVAFFFEASDDYGLDRVELVVMSDRGQELGRATVRAPKGERLCRGDHTVSVARLGLEAGDSAEVWFEAVDLNSLTGPGVTRSQARRLTLYSPEAEHERLLARLDAVIDAMIDVLADRLESPVEERDRFRLRDYVSIGQGISAKQGKILNSLTALLGGLSTDALASQELRDGIRQVRDRLQDVQDQEAVHLRKAVIGSATAHDRVMVSLLYGANEEGVAETETGVLTLDELLDQSRKDSILDAGRELLETQHEIMELLKKIKDTKDPEALQQAMKKLDRLQKKLAKLQDELSKLRERVPYENQNRSQRPSDNQVSMKDMKSTMDRIQELLAQGKVDEAMKLLEELNKSTQELMASLQDDLERGGGMSAAAQQKAQELSTKLDELADGQRGLRSETGEVDRQISERQARQLQQRAKQALESAKAQAEALKQTLEGVDRAPLHDSDREALEALEEAAESLEQEVADGKVGEAAERARELAEQVEALEREVGESEARELDEARLAGLKAGREELDKGQAQAEALAKELAGLQPKPGEGLEPGEASEVKRLGERQEQLRERLKQLKDALPELDKEMPGIEAEMSEPLDKAGQSMSEARDQLGDKRPGKASDKQQEALEQIEKAQQKMSEQMQQRQAGNDGQEQQGPNDPNAKVEIPKEDPYATPRDFRRELLDAMRERAPDQYRDAIEEFYKGLMK
ncbi:MAG: hypothetical protein CSA66_06435 [Proteobacteria bacterium]|nr:MAG: hypothetical protein CSA66_06435 [Pseudomonadota bacterium]